MKTALVVGSLVFMSGLAVLSGKNPPPPPRLNYSPVKNWPKLPDNKKLGAVTAVALDGEDRVYLFHRASPPIMVFDREGRLLRGFGEGLIKTAHGLRLDPEGNVWTTDIGNHLVRKFDPQGKLLLTLGTKDEPGEDGKHFNRPADVAVSPQGDIFVADGYGNSRVAKFARDGKFLKAWGKKGKGEGEFNLPHAIVIDSKGRIHVGDRENNRVQIFDAEGKFLAQWRDSGAPYGLFLDKERWLVADGRAHLINFLDAEGKRVGQFGMKGAMPAEFLMPHSLCVDSTGALYVAEVTGKRVQKLVRK
ncbi:MAG: peptidyl-alpha-hydroxyglycine alpha-amidating lyase family protein [Gemmataceae bacterium]